MIYNLFYYLRNRGRKGTIKEEKNLARDHFGADKDVTQKETKRRTSGIAQNVRLKAIAAAKIDPSSRWNFRKRVTKKELRLKKHHRLFLITVFKTEHCVILSSPPGPRLRK